MVSHLALTHTRTIVGIEAPLVMVEAHISGGMPGFSMVGLPETAVRESKDRVRSAILNSGLTFPARRLTVNLAPADLPKHGSRFDLAIAIAMLAASRQIEIEQFSQYEFMGELALSGALRPVPYGLIQAIASSKQGFTLFLPEENLAEAQLCQHAKLKPAKNLLDVIQQISSTATSPLETMNECSANTKNSSLCPTMARPQGTFSSTEAPQPAKSLLGATNQSFVDAIEQTPPPFSDVIGQHIAKRALTIAAVGGHSCLLSGPPGVGKSMLARQFHHLLPPLQQEAAMDSLAIYSCYRPHAPCKTNHLPPHRAPHHTVSTAALIGGGNPPKPGEISLAHHGVLLLDELPEYARPALEALREPLETGHIHIARAKHSVIFPANFQLIATMNPCPCGYLGCSKKPCQCTPGQIQQYQKKLSGPLLDRFDIMVTMQRNTLATAQIETPIKKEKSPNLKDSTSYHESHEVDLRLRIQQARERQLKRQNKLNTELTASEIQAQSPESLRIALNKLCETEQLSMRGRDRSLKIARSIADLEGAKTLSTEHLYEALSYKPSLTPHA